MKNLFAFGALALALTVASCGNGSNSTENTDSTAVDSTVVALTDSIAVTDSTITETIVVDSTVNAQ